MLLKTQGVVSGKMFRYPAYYIQKKLLACGYENGDGIKIPEDKANQLKVRGSNPLPTFGNGKDAGMDSN